MADRARLVYTLLLLLRSLPLRLHHLGDEASVLHAVLQSEVAVVRDYALSHVDGAARVREDVGELLQLGVLGCNV